MPSISYLSFQRTKEEHNFYRVVPFPFVNGRAKSRIQAPCLSRHNSFYSMILSLSVWKTVLSFIQTKSRYLKDVQTKNSWALLKWLKNNVMSHTITLTVISLYDPSTWKSFSYCLCAKLRPYQVKNRCKVLCWSGREGACLKKEFYLINIQPFLIFLWVSFL